ncbi:MFS transporter [Streptomyces sp. NBC_01210]|uniref:MFS transporter n=1 Tax=Streptomyces sp. NBC_01210 TaxID=2903774 RepID=UPI002E14BB08|nr:MFS transporter [Streptomyces sp. NBC_01210]
MPVVAARSRRVGPPTRLLTALAAMVFGTAPLAVVPGLWSMAAGILVAGLGIAVTLVGSYSIAQVVVPVEHRTEGVTWLTTATSAGTALGAPLAGHLLDAFGSAAGFLLGFAAGLIALAVTGLGRRAPAA